MKKYSKLVFMLCLFFVGINFVSAAPRCQTQDSSWEYDKTETMSESNQGTSSTSDEKKVVCCSTGGGQTKMYYCDHYNKNNSGSNDDTITEEKEKEFKTNTICNQKTSESLDSNWQFQYCQTHYTEISPEKEVPAVEKVVCGNILGSNAGIGQRFYKCDHYIWIGGAQNAPSDSVKTGPYVGSCEYPEGYVYSYSRLNSQTDVSGSGENSVTCCKEVGSELTGTHRFMCDTYVAKEYADNILEPAEKDSGYYTPSKICGKDGENCNVSLAKFCTKSKVARLLKGVGILIVIAKILVPAIIILMGFVNLFKIITAGKEDEARKYAKSIVTKIIIGVIIFLLPGLINFVFDIANNIIASNNDYQSEFTNCEKCILDIGECNINGN